MKNEKIGKASLVLDAPIINKKQIWIKKIYKPYFDHPYHFHNTLELTWIKSGNGQLIAGDYLGHFEEGEILMFGDGLPHLLRCAPSFYQTENVVFTEAYAIYFTQEFISDIIDDAIAKYMFSQLVTKIQRGIKLKSVAKQKATELFQSIIRSDGFAQIGFFLQLLHILVQTTNYTLLSAKDNQSNPSKTEIDRFSNVYDYLFTHFQKNISLQEIANVCSMTPNAFCRFFKSKTEKTFIQFLTEIRIGHACKLLQHEGTAIKNICYECGFNNPVIFFKSFKNITGKTPKEYQQAVLKIKE